MTQQHPNCATVSPAPTRPTRGGGGAVLQAWCPRRDISLHMKYGQDISAPAPLYSVLYATVIATDKLNEKLTHESVYTYVTRI